MAEPYTFQVWGYIEVVDGKGTAEERYIEDLVGPIKLSASDNLQTAMINLWASTSSSPDNIDLEDVIGSAERIEQEIAEGKYEWTA